MHDYEDNSGPNFSQEAAEEDVAEEHREQHAQALNEAAHDISEVALDSIAKNWEHFGDTGLIDIVNDNMCVSHDDIMERVKRLCRDEAKATEIMAIDIERLGTLRKIKDDKWAEHNRNFVGPGSVESDLSYKACVSAGGAYEIALSEYLALNNAS